MLLSEEIFCWKEKLLLLRDFKEYETVLNPRRGLYNKMKNHGDDIVVLRIENFILKITR